VSLASAISPIYYNIPDAKVTLVFRCERALVADELLRITRPPGYTLLPGSLKGISAISFGASGLDFMRIWSMDFQNPEDMYAVILKPIAALTTIRLSVGVGSPVEAEKVMNWGVRSYIVQPSRDPDGDIIDASLPIYPFVGREINATGTSDGAFIGFLLVGQVPFTITPSLQTPGAEIRLSLNFGIADGVEAISYVRMEVTAPIGFVFKDSCLFQGSPQFAKCTG
ncbi:unnamed protein product, partial [Polarella glacialis]